MKYLILLFLAVSPAVAHAQERVTFDDLHPVKQAELIAKLKSQWRGEVKTDTTYADVVERVKRGETVEMIVVRPGKGQVVVVDAPESVEAGTWRCYKDESGARKMVRVETPSVKEVSPVPQAPPPFSYQYNPFPALGGGCPGGICPRR